MGKAVDLTGQTFGLLTVKDKAGKTKSGALTWNCTCECGNDFVAEGSAMRHGRTSSCGCLKAARDLVGEKYGRLTVKALDHVDSNHRRYWQCECDCGRSSTVEGRNLTAGLTQSCGCLHRERIRQNKKNAKHGAYQVVRQEYTAWTNLRSRDETPAEWTDFVQFFCDVGERPSPHHYLARKDVTKPHGKENTYWRNADDERAAAEQLSSADLPDECVFDFRAHLRATTAGR